MVVGAATDLAAIGVELSSPSFVSQAVDSVVGIDPEVSALRASFAGAPPRVGRLARLRSPRLRPREVSAPPVRARGGRLVDSIGVDSLALERERSFVFFFTSENCEALPMQAS